MITSYIEELLRITKLLSNRTYLFFTLLPMRKIKTKKLQGIKVVLVMSNKFDLLILSRLE